jgi:hypothetical protein
VRSVLGGILIYPLIKILLLAVGIGIGFLLHWRMPMIDLGIGVLIGVIATGFSLFFFDHIATMPDPDFIEGVPTEPLPRVTYLINLLPPRQRRKRKPA